MNTDRKARGLFYLCSSVCICGSILFLFFSELGERDLWGSHEARAAQDAQRILDERDWLIPRLFDDQIELQKPPLYYWLAAACGWFRDGHVDAVAARLPAALAGCATVLVVFGFLAQRGRPFAGLLAATALLGAHHFVWIARTARIDIPLTWAVTGSVLCVSAGGRAAVVGYLLMGIGVLLKGPLGVVLPLAVLTANALVERRAILPRSAVWGLPLVLAVAAPWFVVAHWRTDGQFTRVFFWYHHIQRATGGAEAMASHPWWFYGPRFAVDFLPVSLFLPLAGWLAVRRSDIWADRDARLGLIWLVVVVLLLSASRFKRADYLLPAYPGAALWLGCVGERAYESWRSPLRGRWLMAGAAGTLALLAFAWAVFLHTQVPRMDQDRERRTLAAAIRHVAPAPEQVLFFRVEDHLLAYHLGRPLNTFLEWENLDIWAGRPGRHHILMPAECAAAWRQYISSGELDEVLRSATAPTAAGRAIWFSCAPARRPPATRRDLPMSEPSDRPRTSHEPISTLLPVYNQAAGLETIVDSWLRALDRLDRPFEFIIIDDGSADGTAAAADRFAARHSTVRVLRHDSRRGFGAALRTGLAEARHPLIFYTACDYPYAPTDLKKLLSVIHEADLATGTRTDALPVWLARLGRVYRTIVRVVCGVQLEPRPGWLGWAAWRQSVRSRLLFGLRLWDVTSAFKLFRRSLLDRIPIQSDGDFVHAELLAKANFLGGLMAEVPIGRLPGTFRGAVEPPPTGINRAAEARRVFRRPEFAAVQSAGENTRLSAEQRGPEPKN